MLHKALDHFETLLLYPRGINYWESESETEYIVEDQATRMYETGLRDSTETLNMEVVEEALSFRESDEKLTWGGSQSADCAKAVQPIVVGCMLQAGTERG